MTSPTGTYTPPAPSVEETNFEDYFGFEKSEVYTLPDGKQQIFFRVMNEGDKTKYQQKINKDIHVNQNTRDMRLKTDPAGDRHELIATSVTGWSLKMRDASGNIVDAPFSNNGTPGSLFMQWLNKANPRIVEALEDAIRKANPWLMDNMTVEQIDTEMSRLADLRKELVTKTEREAQFS